MQRSATLATRGPISLSGICRSPRDSLQEFRGFPATTAQRDFLQRSASAAAIRDVSEASQPQPTEDAADEALARLLRESPTAGTRLLLQRFGTPTKTWLHLTHMTGEADLIDECVEVAAKDLCLLAVAGELPPTPLRRQFAQLAEREFALRRPHGTTF